MTDSFRSRAMSFSVLAEIEWSYPPVDGIRSPHDGGWFGPKRCPICFADWNLKAVHKAGCRLKAALLNDAAIVLKGN